MKIPNRYEIHYVLDGGFTQKIEAKDTLKEANGWFKNPSLAIKTLSSELKEAGLESHYAEHGYGLYPTDSNGVPFTVSYFATTGDPLADLSEDMAAEQKARATYENLINLTDDPDVIGPLLFLRQREIIHFARFKELFDEYKSKGIK